MKIKKLEETYSTAMYREHAQQQLAIRNACAVFCFANNLHAKMHRRTLGSAQKRMTPMPAARTMHIGRPVVISIKIRYLHAQVVIAGTSYGCPPPPPGEY